MFAPMFSRRLGFGRTPEHFDRYMCLFSELELLLWGFSLVLFMLEVNVARTCKACGSVWLWPQ